MNAALTSGRSSRLAATNAAGITAALALLSEAADASVLVFDGPYKAGWLGETNFGDPLSYNPGSSDAGYYYPSSSTPAFSFSCVSGINGTYFSPSESIDTISVGFEQYSHWFVLSRLSEGTTIGSSNATSSGYAIDPTDYVDGDRFYIGYGFREEGSSGAYNYGWAEISFEETSLTLHRWAYETTAGESIVAGIPEPTSAAMIFTGLCVAAWSARRRSTRKRLAR